MWRATAVGLAIVRAILSLANVLVQATSNAANPLNLAVVGTVNLQILLRAVVNKSQSVEREQSLLSFQDGYVRWAVNARQEIGRPTTTTEQRQT